MSILSRNAIRILLHDKGIFLSITKNTKNAIIRNKRGGWVFPRENKEKRLQCPLKQLDMYISIVDFIQQHWPGHYCTLHHYCSNVQTSVYSHTEIGLIIKRLSHKAPMFPHNNDNDPILRGNWGIFCIIWGEIKTISKKLLKLDPLTFWSIFLLWGVIASSRSER